MTWRYRQIRHPDGSVGIHEHYEGRGWAEQPVVIVDADEIAADPDALAKSVAFLAAGLERAMGEAAIDA